MPGQNISKAEGGSADHPGGSSYEVVVIGGGIGGLTAGALLARAGKKVLVVEAEAEPGGYTRALRDGSYTFDRADHLIWGCEEDGPFGPGLIDAVLRYLGVRDRCEFIRMDDPIYEARFPDFTLSVPHGREAYLQAHLRHSHVRKPVSVAWWNYVPTSMAS
jgi:all-trans-retinol 13,14-reductase